MSILSRLFGRSEERKKLERAATELTAARDDLRKAVSGLGQEVWQMVETGDALGALVHGAQRAKFHREIGEGEDK